MAINAFDRMIQIVGDCLNVKCCAGSGFYGFGTRARITIKAQSVTLDIIRQMVKLTAQFYRHPRSRRLLVEFHALGPLRRCIAGGRCRARRRTQTLQTATPQWKWNWKSSCIDKIDLPAADPDRVARKLRHRRH